MTKRKKLTKVETEEKISDLENRWKRAVADYLNLEKRFEKEKKAFLGFANTQLLDKILPIGDELEICAEHLKDEGLTMVLAKLRSVLASEGIEEIRAEGERFDPETMDAVEICAGPKNRVIAIVLRGYRLGDKVLRPVKVKVGGG